MVVRQPAIAAPASCEPYLGKAAEVLQQAELAVVTRRQDEAEAAARAQRFVALWQEGALSRRQAEQAQSLHTTAKQNLERAIATADKARSQWQELQSLTDCAQYQPATLI
jgi:multidrug resistance efflux pump